MALNPKEHPHLDLVIDDGVATLTLNRPEKKNAISAAMWTAIAGIVSGIGGEVRAIVLTGRGGNFSAGADIAEFDTLRADAASARAYERLNSAAFAAVRNAPVPTLAAISGICFGGGFGPAAACDIRIGAPDARFAIPAARLGLAYPEDAMGDIVHALGAQRARHLAYTAGVIDAQAALAAGFLLEIYAAPETRALTIARTIAENAPLSIRASKAAIAAVLAAHPAANAAAQTLGDRTFDSADYAEGRAAFKARRKPVFTGS